MPMVPKLGMGVIDVRDVALAHLRAMRIPEANGQRFILCERTIWFKDLALILDKEFAPLGTVTKKRIKKLFATALNYFHCIQDTKFQKLKLHIP